MSTITLIVIIVVALVVVALLGVLALTAVQRRNQARAERRGEAQQLRESARSQSPQVHDALLQADQAEAEAARLRARADEADAEAARLRRAAAAEEATQEDAVREADRLDPDVDPKAEGYRPAQHLGEREPVAPAADEPPPPDPMEDPRPPRA